MGGIAWKGVILEGWPVLSILFIGSIVSLAVIFEKWKLFSKVQTSSNVFLESLKKSDIQMVVKWCEKSDQPLAAIALKVLKAPSNREDKERMLQRAIQWTVQKLETKLSVLGTVATVAPFVGLLGTVVGIIKSFHAVSSNTAGGASMVALGISEALIGTAGGLVVAIPALLGYNYFINKLRRLVQEWELAGAEIIDWALQSPRGQ